MQSKQDAAKHLLEWIDEDVLPVKYGGKNPGFLKESEFEARMSDYVDSVCNSKS